MRLHQSKSDTETDRAFDPRTLALSYWAGLEAPVERVARALHDDQARVADDLARWIETASAPARSETQWAARTAVTLIRQGLARPAGEQLVFAAGEGVLTAGETAALAARIAGGLADRGLGRGARVAADATQRLESYLVTLGALLAGTTVVRLGDTVGPETLRSMVAAAPAAITFSDRFATIGAMAETGEQVRFDDLDTFIAGCPEPGDDPLAALPEVRPDDAAFVGFTSGSTGAPRPMLTSHEAVFRSTELAQSAFGFDASDIFCTATDFTALSAFRSLVTLPFASGGRVVIPDAEARSDPLALALVCERYGVTRLTAVPGVLRALCKAGARVGPAELRALRTFLSGSGVLDFATADMVRERLGIPVVDYYGGREFATAAYSDPDSAHTMSAGGGELHGCLALIVDDDHQLAAPGATGEIVVHSDSMTLSDLPSIATSGKWAGWHFTGDLGRFVAGGRLEIVGRKKDIIKAPDGTLVSPAEIEGALNALSWVGEAAVFAWTDGEGIERVGAAIIALADAPHEAERAAMRAVRASHGAHKTPARVLILDSFPRVARGKPDKARLRQILRDTTKGPIDEPVAD